jgi:putative membrane protein
MPMPFALSALPFALPLEALLAYLHIAAILGVVVFLGSEAALTRPEWLNAAVVQRLVRVDLLYLVAAVVLLATGLARTWWGIKGTGWYWHQPLLHAKLGLFVLIGGLSVVPTLRFQRWRKLLLTTGALPAEAEVRSTRRWVMAQAHLLLVVPALAVCLARGLGTR